MKAPQRLPLSQWLGAHWRQRPLWAVPLLIALGAHGLLLFTPQLPAQRPHRQAQQANDQAELLDISQQLLSENQASSLNSQPLQLPIDTLPLPPADSKKSSPGGHRLAAAWAPAKMLPCIGRHKGLSMISP